MPILNSIYVCTIRAQHSTVLYTAKPILPATKIFVATALALQLESAEKIAKYSCNTSKKECGSAFDFALKAYRPPDISMTRKRIKRKCSHVSPTNPSIISSIIYQEINETNLAT